MNKCVRCGGSLLLRGKIRLADAAICFKCFDELGFDHKTGIYTGSLYKWDDIKDGIQAYWNIKNAETAASKGLSLSHWNQLSAARATDLEEKLFSAMCAIWEDEGCDVSRLVIAPGERGSLLVLLDGTVVLQYKGERQVRWILFPDSPDKVRIGNSARINGLAKRLVSAYNCAK